MPKIAYGKGAYRRDNGNMPELRLKNLFLEASITAEEGAVLVSRKGLAPFISDVGSGPIRGLFCAQNVFGSDVFSVSSGVLYRNNAVVGNVSGTGPVSFAAGSSTELAISLGGPVYRYDGSTLVAVAFPDNQSVASIVFHDGLYIAAVANSNRWYWSDVLDADTWEVLNFASAEAKPDTLRDIQIVQDFVFLCGAETIEKWSNTGDATIPYSRIEGSMIDKGVIATGCTTPLDNTILFVGNDGIVYRLAETIQRLSDHSIEERIAGSNSVSTFGFILDGHSFFCIRLDTITLLYDIATGEWCEFATHGRTNWRIRCACTSGLKIILGDDTEGTLWVFNGWQDDDEPIERLFTAVFPVEGGTAVIDNLIIEVNTGRTEELADQGVSPIAELRASRDSGATWGTWRSASIGAQGRYRVKTQWHRCGLFDFPSGMFEIRVTDPVPFRVSSVLVNEPNGGRSR